MNRYLKHENLPWMTLLAGAVGLLLRLWLQSTEDSRGFIIRGHISKTLLMLLTALFLLFLLRMVRDLKQAGKFRFNFPPSPVAAVGTALAGAGAVVSALTELIGSESTLQTLAGLAALAAAAALAFAARCRWKGEKPNLLPYAAVCLWLMLRLICRYRDWSSDPQLEDYVSELLALVCCMLASYHRAAFCANEGRRAPYAFFCLAGVYFCAVSLSGPEGAAVYLALGLWLLTDICDLRPMPARRRRAPQ